MARVFRTGLNSVERPDRQSLFAKLILKCTDMEEEIQRVPRLKKKANRNGRFEKFGYYEGSTFKKDAILLFHGKEVVNPHA